MLLNDINSERLWNRTFVQIDVFHESEKQCKTDDSPTLMGHIANVVVFLMACNVCVSHLHTVRQPFCVYKRVVVFMVNGMIPHLMESASSHSVGIALTINVFVAPSSPVVSSTVCVCVCASKKVPRKVVG